MGIEVSQIPAVPVIMTVGQHARCITHLTCSIGFGHLPGAVDPMPAGRRFERHSLRIGRVRLIVVEARRRSDRIPESGILGYVAGRRTVDKHSAVVAEARDVLFGTLIGCAYVAASYTARDRCAFLATVPSESRILRSNS